MGAFDRYFPLPILVPNGPAHPIGQGAEAIVDEAAPPGAHPSAMKQGIPMKYLVIGGYFDDSGECVVLHVDLATRKVVCGRRAQCGVMVQLEVGPVQAEEFARRVW